ncbi:Peptidase propeptide and YPEB domain-containing protein [Colwellia chukchiensis]|uniref:Peptidase propeptide and YPEB domain-containing protein n=1 Tax=Colwellia chukchiensis TaxID=641665 RepID=A0A1H7KBK4_9GAMM|nr:PepSY domain-containing protein [Colwellia chukchiensis]SEK83305.1 Peptidase propeptide and YPEB domain-containing protein [Colwellia chukchiensis]
MKKQLFFLSVLVTLIATPAVAALKVTPNQQIIVEVANRQASNSQTLNAQQAARLVKRKFGGKILKVNHSGSKQNPSYRVKLLKKNGHVISVIVDAKSGRVSGY